MRSYIAFAVVFHAVALQAFAGNDRATDMRRTIESIRSEIQNSPAHAWAGEYRGHEGIDTFTTLYVAPKAGIAYEMHGNSGVYESNCGSIEIDGDKISISWRHPEEHAHVPTIERELLVVLWDDLVFLVPRCAIHRFCLDAKQHRYRLLSSELTRNSGAQKQLAGKPTLPNEFQIFWDLPQMEASNVSIAKPQFKKIDAETTRATQTVTLDKGSAQHIYVGMSLECPRIARRFTVTATDQDSCTAESIVVVKSGSPLRPARRRWRLTTSTR